MKKKDKNIATVIVIENKCNENDLTFQSVHTMDKDLAVIEPYKIGRGGKSYQVDIKVHNDINTDYYVSRVQGSFFYINGNWIYRQESNNSRTIYISSCNNTAIEVKADVTLNNGDILMMGWNDKQNTFCCAVVFMPYKVGLRIKKVPFVIKKKENPKVFLFGPLIFIRIYNSLFYLV